MKTTICILISFFAMNICAQHIVSSKTTIRTCINKRECTTVDNPGYLFYDESKNEFYFKIDPKEIEEITPINEWLKDFGDSSLYFKGHFPKENFPPATNHHTQIFNVNGQSFINGLWKNQTVELVFFSSENQTLNPSTGGGEYDVYNVSFSFSFLPHDYALDEKPHHLINPIFITVSNGRINELKPGMEDLLQEAYYH